MTPDESALVSRYLKRLTPRTAHFVELPLAADRSIHPWTVSGLARLLCRASVNPAIKARRTNTQVGVPFHLQPSDFPPYGRPLHSTCSPRSSGLHLRRASAARTWSHSTSMAAARASGACTDFSPAKTCQSQVTVRSSYHFYLTGPRCGGRGRTNDCQTLLEDNVRNVSYS